MANLWGVVITVLACCLRKDFALDFNPVPVPIPPIRPGGPDVGPRPPNRTIGPPPIRLGRTGGPHSGWRERPSRAQGGAGRHCLKQPPRPYRASTTSDNVAAMDSR